MGIDLGDKRSRFCGLDAKGKVAVRGSLDTSAECFADLLPHCCRVAIEVGTHSPWVSGNGYVPLGYTPGAAAKDAA